VPPGASQIIKPETAESYEIGAKATLMSGRLLINGAAHRTDVSDYQATQLFLNPATGSFTSYITNAAQIRTQGLEVDSNLFLKSGFRTSLSLAFTDAKYLSYPNAPCALVNATGRCDLSRVALPNVSKWAAHLGLGYEAPWSLAEIGQLEVRPFALLDASYRSGFFGAPSRQTRIDEHTVVRVAAGIRVPGAGVSVSAWARNLFNEKYYLTKSSLIFNTGIVTGSLGEPRTVGLTIQKIF
jgi:iron complex outermembrane receptor protein